MALIQNLNPLSEIRTSMKIAVVIPAFKVAKSLQAVIESIGPEVHHIIVVDDACPENSGRIAQSLVPRDSRIEVLFHSENLGVGGAVVTGYRKALSIGADLIVKLDGDGQMDAELIPKLIEPILQGHADYVKGNRFDTLEDLIGMPKLRVLGNAALSLMTKISTGYWTVNDPTNGFTAIHRLTLEKIHLGKLRKTYFFESDMLFRLSISSAKVSDFSMKSRYGDEESNLRIWKVLLEFPVRHAVNLMKRILYRYYLREWSIASFELPIGIASLVFGMSFGLNAAGDASALGRAATAGQVTLSAVAIILGIQLLLSFLAFDIQAEPSTARQKR